MELTKMKEGLAKKLYATNDEEMLGFINAILEIHSPNEPWFEQLPEEIKQSIEQGLAEADRGEGIPHKEVMKTYAKWLKK